MYLSPLRREIVARNGGKLKRRLLWILAAMFCIFLVHLNVKDDPTPSYRIAVPLVWIVGLQAFMAAADFFSCMLLIPKSKPAAESHEAMEFYKGFGHPTHLFSRLPDLGEKLRHAGQPNRTYINRGEKATVAVSDVGEFGGLFYIERQPQPLDSGRTESAYVLLAAGWLLRLIGCVLFLFLVLPPEFHDFAITGIVSALPFSPFLFVVAMLFVAASAWRNGGRYYKQALDLIRSARFLSIGILINVTGDLSRADINVGKAATDSMESRNVSARSNFTARFWAAELVSEARNAAEARDLLALNQTEESLVWVDHFKQGIHLLRDERVTPAGINFKSQELDEINRTNTAIFADRARAMAPSVSSNFLVAAPLQISQDATPTTPVEAQAEAPSANREETKECPQCAEIVRARAKKCRFCGHEFEQMT